MPLLCNSMMSFSTVLHNVLSKSFWCITPPNMKKKSISIVCTKFEKEKLDISDNVSPCRFITLEFHTVRQD